MNSRLVLVGVIDTDAVPDAAASDSTSAARCHLTLHGLVFAS
jgi:hypothetical protein